MGRYRWARWGDVNAFFGLMLDNVVVMLILVGTVSSSVPPEKQEGRYTFTQQFVLTRMIPGTALGVLFGDLVYTWMAFRLARRLGRDDVTAMPLGLDTPSTFGVAFFVLLPALQEARGRLGMDPETAMTYAWHVGVLVLLTIGLFKVAFAPFGNAVRRWVPRAGLLGSLAAIALALIAFLPLAQDIAALPVVGMLALTVILVSLIAHRALPGQFPGALAALLLGLAAYLASRYFGTLWNLPLVPRPEGAGAATAWTAPTFLSTIGWDRGWWEQVWWAAVAKLPIAIPFALATIVGGIDCTESAAAAGDEYDTRTILLTEGVTSVAGALLGGVLQTTPYIGQPAYKAMGGRAAYTLATALFIGAAGYFGWFTHFFEWLPKAALAPILVYVGLEITAQSFRATPVRHYAALALAVLPALARLAMICLDQALAGRPPDPASAALVQTLRCLANGFIITSLLWAAALAALLDGKLVRAAAYLLSAGVLSLFGIIHSPLPDEPIALPGTVFARLTEEASRLPAGGVAHALYQTPYHWFAAYALAAILVLVLAAFPGRSGGEGAEAHPEA
jgi:AGZA family xanthine/uracil permease-like MFS transporter